MKKIYFAVVSEKQDGFMSEGYFESREDAMRFAARRLKSIKINAFMENFNPITETLTAATSFADAATATVRMIEVSDNFFDLNPVHRINSFAGYPATQERPGIEKDFDIKIGEILSDEVFTLDDLNSVSTELADGETETSFGEVMKLADMTLLQLVSYHHDNSAIQKELCNRMGTSDLEEAITKTGITEDIFGDNPND